MIHRRSVLTESKYLYWIEVWDAQQLWVDQGYNAETGVFIRPFDEHIDYIDDADYSPDGTLILNYKQ